jgi:hypothetical protein
VSIIGAWSAREDKEMKVRNLSNGDIIYYSPETHPARAVMYAWLQSKGYYNTWDYDALFTKNQDQLILGKYTVAMGDFTAFHTTPTRLRG